MTTVPSPRFQAFTFGFILAAMLAALAVACSDDSPAASKRPLLVDKPWMVVRYALNGEDVTDEREACELDDVTTFFGEGVFVESIGDVACEEGEEDTQGKWEFKANETILSMQETGSTASDWTVVALTTDSLKISQYAAALKMEVVIVMAPL